MSTGKRKDQRRTGIIKALQRREEGQGLVEFALVLPILITILCGIIDFGWIYSQKYTVEHAAFEGARYATVCGDAVATDDVEEHVHSVLSECSVSTSITASEVSVTVSKDIPIFTFVASTFFGSNYHATSTAVAARN